MPIKCGYFTKKTQHNEQNHSVKKNVEEIFSSTNLKEKVLCIGEVQSGKTKTIIEVIKESCIRGYSCAVVLGGTNKLLTKQTINRASDDIPSKIGERKVRIIVDGSNDIEKTNQFLREKVFIVFVILKGTIKIQNIITKFFKYLVTKNKKILLIDDESDFGGIGGSKKNTKISMLLEEIYGEIFIGKFLLFTGTPFANIANKSDELSEIDRFVVLGLYEGYAGNGFFLKNKECYWVLDASKEDWKESIETSTILWLVSTALIRFKINDDKYPSEFLLNVDLKNATHARVEKKVRSVLNHIYRYAVDNKKIETIMKRRFPDFINLIDHVRSKIPHLVEEVLKNDYIFVLNNENKNNYCSDNQTMSIVIGGFIISRGFTFKNLITELLINSPKESISLDTTLQRCRWFGNRTKDDVYKYMTILINESNYKALKVGNEITEIILENRKSSFAQLQQTIEEYNRENRKEKIQLSGKK